MEIQKIERYRISLPLKQAFHTSYGVIKKKQADILCLTDKKGNKGIGELTALVTPDYIEETLETQRIILERFLLPELIKQSYETPQQWYDTIQHIKGNYMAKACIETALFDLYCKNQKKSLSQCFPKTKTHVNVGISLGIEKNIPKLLHTIETFLKQGYTRVKLKIKPEYDIEPIQAIRKKYPSLLLMVDANSSYTLNDIEHLKKLDQYHLEMIEQPFSAYDFLDHSVLQRAIKTRVCLDENIRTVKDCQLAYQLKSCQAINLKISRVGGLIEAQKIVSFCQEKNLLVWLGGMYETGVGRAFGLHFASQKALSFPGDLSAFDRYFEKDILTTPFVFNKGKLKVPTGLGLGVTLNTKYLDHISQKEILYQK